MSIAGAASLVVGAVALGALTSPDQLSVAEETTTTTTGASALDRPIDLENFSVGQLEQGLPFAWERVLELPELYPYEVVSVADGLILFASAVDRWAPTSEVGLSAWRSRDGVDWEPLGEVIPASHRIVAIESTPQGLIALEPGEPGGGFGMWRSKDGADWAREEMAVESGSELAVAYPSGVGSAGSLTVIAGQVQVDTTAVLARLITETYGVEVELSRFGWSNNISADDVEFVIHGPLGIPIFTASAKEMGLSEDERQILIEGYSGDDSFVWVSWGDDSGWVQGPLPEGSWMDSIVEMPNGSLQAFGYGGMGQTSWESFDGLHWEPISSSMAPWSVTVWGDRYVGADGNRADILISADGTTWVTTGLGDLFPVQLGWSQSQVATGPGGIATFLQGWGDSPRARPNPQPVTLVDGAATLTLDFGTSVIALTSGSTTRTWQMWSLPGSEGIEADLATESITFRAGADGEIEATFSFEELIEAESSFWRRHGLDDQHHAFAFSANAENWTIQDVGPILGEDKFVTGARVTDGRVVALVVRYDQVRVPNAGLEVWTAAIP